MQWDVGRELRRRVKKAFDAHGIEMPDPRMMLTVPPSAPAGDTPPPAPEKPPTEGR
jgi:hypothetical protein